MATRSSTAKSSAALDPALPQKKRARRRLVGAAAVCLAAAIVLPLVFDSEPRQLRDDVQVSIPSRDTPLNERDASQPQSATGTITPYPGGARDGRRPLAEGEQAARGDDASRRDDEPASSGESKNGGGESKNGGAADSKHPPETKSAVAAEPKAAGVPEPRADAVARAAPDAKAADPKPEARSADAKDTKDAKPASYLLQAGAFGTEKAAQEQLERVRKTGVKTYTEKVKTAQGERIRVRIGPFASKEAAERARAKLKAAGIDTALIAP